MSNPLVSVIIPVYNVSKYIVQTLASVFSQNFTDYEIIIVDDGSTDETQSVLKSYSDKINYIYQSNRGPAAARNTGIKMATGKYIAFLDGDDLWTDGKLEQQVKLLESHPDVRLLSGDMLRFTGDRVVILSMFEKYGFDRNFFEDDFYVINAYKKIFTFGNYIPTGTVIMKRDCFEKTGYFDENLRHSEDCDLWLRVAMHYKVAYSRRVWLQRRDHENNLTGDSESMNMSLINVLEKHERQFKPYLIQNGIDANALISDRYRNTGYVLLLNNQLSNARACFKKSFSRGFKMRTLLYWLTTFLGVSTMKAIRYIKN